MTINQANSNTLHRSLIKDCEACLNLSNWEFDFIASIKDRLEDDKPLTDKQIEILERISERV
jgi:hypothetical protein